MLKTDSLAFGDWTQVPLLLSRETGRGTPVSSPSVELTDLLVDVPSASVIEALGRRSTAMASIIERSCGLYSSRAPWKRKP